MAPADGPCHRHGKPCCHYSHHGPQFWGVGRSFDLIAAHEARMHRRYGWAVRSRPDAKHGPRVVAAVKEIVRNAAGVGASSRSRATTCRTDISMVFSRRHLSFIRFAARRIMLNVCELCDSLASGRAGFFGSSPTTT